MMTQRYFAFSGGVSGIWRVTRQDTVIGESIGAATRIDVLDGTSPERPGSVWTLRGITSNERYVTRDEKSRLTSRQEGLGRASSTCAALIPIRKSAAWWAMPQDDRRRIFEEQSDHIRIGLKYLPAIARRLHHCRDLVPAQPFDFLTWFEYSPQDSAAFEELLGALRASEEWRYVEREIDLRVERDPA